MSCWGFSHSLSFSYENTTVSTRTSVTNYSNTDEIPTPSQHTSASNPAVRRPGQAPPVLPLQERCAMGPKYASYMCVAMNTNNHFHTWMPVLTQYAMIPFLIYLLVYFIFFICRRKLTRFTALVIFAYSLEQNRQSIFTEQICKWVNKYNISGLISSFQTLHAEFTRQFEGFGVLL